MRRKRAGRGRHNRNIGGGAKRGSNRRNITDRRTGRRICRGIKPGHIHLGRRPVFGYGYLTISSTRRNGRYIVGIMIMPRGRRADIGRR
jgi:hypothetical protein